jgi:hypothetical protein
MIVPNISGNATATPMLGFAEDSAPVTCMSDTARLSVVEGAFAKVLDVPAALFSVVEEGAVLFSMLVVSSPRNCFWSPGRVSREIC